MKARTGASGELVVFVGFATPDLQLSCAPYGEGLQQWLLNFLTW